MKVRNTAMSHIGNAWYSYDTCIAVLHNGVWIVNATKYSSTTSRHQAEIGRDIRLGFDPAYVFDLPRGATADDLIAAYTSTTSMVATRW